MKAGLITIHDIFNYGSVLQAYATQRVMQSIADDVCLIDYKKSNDLKTDSSFLARQKARVLSFANRSLKDLIPGKKYSAYCANYSRAKRRWYSLSEKCYRSPSALVAGPPVCDSYVVGSDQVWHPRTAAVDSSFFLNFAPPGTRRISYASSFGSVDIPRDLVSHYRHGLNNLDCLSVRERSGAALVRRLTGRRAEVVLDPTLLLTGDEWRAEAVMTGRSKPYIVCYGFNRKSDYMERFAVHLARQTGWEIVRLNGTFLDYFRRDIRYILDAGPQEFLGLLSGARLIIGQSFHATVFAVSFARPFISLLRGEIHHDARQKEFLDLVGMKSCALVCGEAMPDAWMLNLDPTFQHAHEVLAQERERSVGFLRSALC